MTITVFILSVVASILGALIYALFLSKREDALRTLMRQMHAGWIKRRYIRIFIHAVRGEAKAADSRAIVQLLLIYPIFAMSMGWWLFFSLRNMDQNVDVLVTQAEDVVNERGAPAETVDSTMAAIKSDADELKGKVSHLYPQIIAFLVLAHLAFYWMVFVWQPFVVFRSRFAHELDRFLLRIQGLASKKELADLAQLEARVHDEDTAIEYVNKMAAIARRHDVDHLVDTFLLWGPPKVEADT